MKAQEFRKTKGVAAAIMLTGVAALVAGCVERRVVYVPTYQVSPTYAPPVYTYQPQPMYQPPPAPNPGQPPAAAPSAPDSAPGATAPAPQPAPPGGSAMMSQVPPPSPQAEVIPVARGPQYVWSAGYWGCNGGWVWVGGSWLVRPHPGAVWVGPHWGRRGRGYVWVGGYWR